MLEAAEGSYWEKMFADYISNKGVLSRIYKGLPKLNSKMQKIQLKYGQKT